MKMTQIPPSSADTLPKQFVVAMRTLFDIMDDKKTGYVKLMDIENRWRDDRTKGLPKGVIESLQKVTPHDGLLSFDRFCAGLKMCLLRNRVENGRRQSPPEPLTLSKMSTVGQTKLQIHRPPSAPLLDIDNTPAQNSNWNANADTVRANGNVTTQRTISMPQLVPRNDQIGEVQHLRYSGESNIQGNIHLPPSAYYGPPKPPRLGSAIDKVGIEKSDILANLQQWKISQSLGIDLEDKLDIKLKYPDDPLLYFSHGGRGPGDGKSSNEQQQPTDIFPKKTTTRRREPRRHTLQNGIDYNMLKRMKQIEQEKDILVQGLAAIETAREWYLKQLGEVQEKMRYASRMGTHVEQWTEAQQERLELQRARVLELNRQLAALAECWQRGGLSLHMNLALAPQTSAALPAHAANRLKHQNHLLTEEVSKKSERIAILEREKSGLVRELLQITNRNKNPENVF